MRAVSLDHMFRCEFVFMAFASMDIVWALCVVFADLDFFWCRPRKIL